ncbi:MAG TPA: tetratricopeptide repeat protein [Terriglobales bacterium]|nr:tetratricopeptide repeat protein [Terriglobales bacterium]
MKLRTHSALLGLLLTILTSASAWCATTEAHIANTLLILPFENQSHAPGLEWISESFPVVLNQRMSSGSMYIIGRDERLYAFDRLGIPAGVKLSRATVFEVAQQMDVDYVVLGHYNFDGQNFQASAQLLDMKTLRLSSEVSESGPLTNLIDLQSALAWDLLRVLDPNQLASRNQFVTASTPIRLDALENYVRGTMAGSDAEKIKRLREAVRLSPSYSLALLQLGKTYYTQRDYKDAIPVLKQVSKDSPQALEANFYVGLSSYYAGDFATAETSFTFVASEMPLTEVYNNLGVVSSRRGKTAAEFFHKAVQADPKDSDYHFNLGVALLRAGDTAGAIAQLREAVALHAEDKEAKGLLDSVTLSHAAPASLPLERIKSNYDETSFRELAMEIDNVHEQRLASSGPQAHSDYHVEQGINLLVQGFVTEAEKEFEEAIRSNSLNAAAHSGLARTREKLNDFARARSEANLALKLQPSAEAHTILGELSLKEGDMQTAQAESDKALALDSSYAAAQTLHHEIAARLAEKAQPLQKP